MKPLEVKSLALDSVRVLRFPRFRDNRGYFSEHFRRSDFAQLPELTFLKSVDFVQCNESFSRSGTIRGLHFQWNPYQGKLVRTVAGRMVDLVLDIRKGSPTFGKIIGYDLPADRAASFQEWIWVPPGFAHGTLFPEESVIEYFCTGEYSPGCEAGISPLAPDLDWSLSEVRLRGLFERVVSGGPLMSEKDKAGFSLAGWADNSRSEQFRMGAV